MFWVLWFTLVRKEHKRVIRIIPCWGCFCVSGDRGKYFFSSQQTSGDQNGEKVSQWQEICVGRVIILRVLLKNKQVLWDLSYDRFFLLLLIFCLKQWRVFVETPTFSFFLFFVFFYHEYTATSRWPWTLERSVLFTYTIELNHNHLYCKQIKLIIFWSPAIKRLNANQMNNYWGGSVANFSEESLT